MQEVCKLWSSDVKYQFSVCIKAVFNDQDRKLET